MKKFIRKFGIANTVAVAFGIGFVIAATVVFSVNLNFRQNSVHVEATIVDFVLRTPTGETQNRLYSAVYEFHFEGTLYRVTQSTSHPGRPVIGNTEPLRINPDNPHDFQLDNPGWFVLPISLGVFGLLIIGGTIGYEIYKRRKQ